MDMNETQQLAQRMISATKEYVARSETVLTKRMDALEARLNNLPAPQRGERGERGDRGERGETGTAGQNGRDADLSGLTEQFTAKFERLQSELMAHLQTGLDAIPAPKQGPQGPPGESVRGEKGDPGEKGDKGDTGEAGRPGLDGAAGVSIKGPPGDKGDQGEAGRAGKDCDMAAVMAAITDQVARLPPPKAGADGRQGDRGQEGPAGRDCDMTEVRALITEAVARIPPPKDGAQGSQGERGWQGVKGDPGEPGRDAAQLDPLPSIDEAKSYRRGTWASHNNGLMMATRTTDAVVNGDLRAAGWLPCVEGIAALVVSQSDKDKRLMEIASVLTGGTRYVTEIYIPYVIDKGVWRPGDYKEGDMVTWDGSGWTAQRDTNAKPGTSPADWRLAIKRGADGRNADGPPPALQDRTVRLK